MADTDTLYNQRILDLAAGLNKDDRLPRPDITVQMDSPLCGSRIRVDLSVKDGLVSEYGQQVRACALGQSAAAIVRNHVIGEDEEGLRAVRDRMQAMLKKDGPPPEGAWSELAVLEPARGHKSRHASIMLPFNALVRAFEQLRQDEVAS